MALTKLLGFMPDADPTTPGAITDCDNLIPTTNGFQNGYQLANHWSAKIPGTLPALTSAKLFTLNSGSSYDGYLLLFVGSNSAGVIRESGYGTYTLHTGSGASGSVCATTFGMSILYSYYMNDFRISASISSASTVIAQIKGPKVLTESNGFVLAFNFLSVTPPAGHNQDEWRCSAHYDASDWTLSATTECTGGRIVEVPGPIQDAKPLGSSVYVYKQNAVFRGDYVGGSEVWRFTRVPGKFGALNTGAVASTGSVHYIAGPDDIYEFNGESFRSIAHGAVREWYKKRAGSQYGEVMVVHDELRGSVVFGMQNIGQALVYDIETKKWGKTSAFGTYPICGAPVYVPLGSNQNAPSEVQRYARIVPGYVEGSGNLFQPTADFQSWASNVGGTFYAEFNEFGSDDDVTKVSNFTLSTIRHADVAGSSETALTLTAYAKNTRGGTFSATTSNIPFNRGKFNLRQSAQFHKFRLSGSAAADVEFSGWAVEAQSGGKR